MYHSSKVYSKDSWSASKGRLDNKEMIVDEILDLLYYIVRNNEDYAHCNKLESFNDFIKTAMQFDEELYSDNQDCDWYYNNIRKNLEKVNEFTLIFLLNCLQSSTMCD